MSEAAQWIVVENPESEDREISLVTEEPQLDSEWVFQVPYWFDIDTAVAYVNLMSEFSDWGSDEAIVAEVNFVNARRPR